MKKALFSLCLLLSAALALCQSENNPGLGSHLPSQAAADAIRTLAGTDGAFLAAGLVNSNYQQDNLASLLNEPTDKIAILNLKGSEIQQALQRSVSLYPQPNTSFLQISGFAVEFKGSGDPGKRILKVTVNGSPLEMGHTYTVAMPLGLAIGGWGYFKIWDRSKITKTLDSTLEAALKGKPFAQTSPRWVLRP